MHRYKQIKSLFFLGIFSLLLLHQSVPHSHHQHEDEQTYKNIAHVDSHSHKNEAQHSHKTNEHDDLNNHQHDALTIIKEHLKKKFFDFFLDVHVHSVVSSEILLAHESNVKQLNFKKDVNKKKVNKSFLINHYSITINYDEAEKIKVYHPPNTYFNPSLSLLDLRGPPFLG